MSDFQYSECNLYNSKLVKSELLFYSSKAFDGREVSSKDPTKKTYN